MKNHRNYLKVTLDMFVIQLMWAFGVLGVLLIVQIFKLFFGNNTDQYYSAFFIIANIFTFVIGIIAIHFLPYYVENGVTRKDYFKGATLASIGLAIILPFLAWGISALTQLILQSISSLTFKEPNLDAMTNDGNLVGDIIQFLILTPYVNPENNLILSLGIFSLNILMYYLAGWLIGAAFYRYHTVIGLGFIAMTLAVLTLVNVLVRNTLNLPVLENYSFIDLPGNIAIPVIVLIALILIGSIRSITKDVTIKMH
ncbi:hypothetical protein [Piscibacillus halophilus]|uniref:hypothetical protein n=1 Tax=Piscibacillus halophilus TaxID=571933 RepID=UPI00158E1BBB|nr:hypothetical protein [Piscibacillus halophilus]